MSKPEIRIYIVDDEPPARRRIAELLERHADVELAGEFGSGPDAVDAIRRAPPDLLFLDVQMPELDGFGVLARVGAERMPLTIFVTAYDRYALDAFEVHALDYLLKPFSDERFDSALDRARRTLRSREREALSEKLLALVAEHRAGDASQAKARSATSPHLDRLAIKRSGRVVFLDVDEIDWIQAAGVYVRIHANGTSHLLRETLGALEKRLDPARFVRIHRSAIVPLDRIAALESDRSGEYRVVLDDGTRLKLSRSYREKLERRLGQQL